MIFIETCYGDIINAEDIHAILYSDGNIIIRYAHGQTIYTECDEYSCSYKSIVRCLLTFIMGHIDEGTSAFIEYSTVMSAARGVEGK